MFNHPSITYYQKKEKLQKNARVNLLKEEKEYAHKRYRSLSEKEKKMLFEYKIIIAKYWKALHGKFNSYKLVNFLMFN